MQHGLAEARKGTLAAEVLEDARLADEKERLQHGSHLDHTWVAQCRQQPQSCQQLRNSPVGVELCSVHCRHGKQKGGTVSASPSMLCAFTMSVWTTVFPSIHIH